MSWSKTPQAGDLHDQMQILVGSAIRLLRGEAGVFVISNEAFDPQSHTEHTLYRLNEATLPHLFTAMRQSMRTRAQQTPVCTTAPPELMAQLGIDHEKGASFELCSLALQDVAGMIGTLYFLRLTGARSCFEEEQATCERKDEKLHEFEASTGNGNNEGTDGGEHGSSLPLFIAQLTASLRFALKSQSLVKEQGRFAAVFQYSAEGILTVDMALRITDFNPAMEHLTGWKESEVLGRFYFEVLRPKDKLGNDLGLEGSPILQAFAGQTVVNREMRIAARDGQVFDVSVTASCVRSLKGEPMNGILNVRDMTRERQQEEQRSAFISVISHELQTPIAIIKGYASTLARADSRLDPQGLHSRLVAIEEETDRLNRLVGNLLYASRIQAHGLQMDVAPLDLGPLIEKVVRNMLARYPGMSVTINIPANLPAVVADRDRIEEVLLNLLDNAMKYSAGQRTATGVVTVACHATGEEVIVAVSDMGMGISLRDQEQIFERFHRVGEPLAYSTPGAGLGLYISRAIIEAHGGQIWVESTLRQGSTFSFSLPREEKAPLPMVVF